MCQRGRLHALLGKANQAYLVCLAADQGKAASARLYSLGLAALQDPGQGLHTGRVQDGVIQDINRHAAVVMEGLPADQAQQHTAEDVAQAVRLARQVLSANPSLKLTHDLDCAPLQCHVTQLVCCC